MIRACGCGRRHGHGGAEAADLLAGDPDDRLARDGLAHVLGFGQRAVAVVDDRLEVGDGARLHVVLRLADLADSEHDALVVLALDDERLDELGADVEHGVVALELLAPLEQCELALRHQAACPIVFGDGGPQQRDGGLAFGGVADLAATQVGTAAALATGDRRRPGHEGTRRRPLPSSARPPTLMTSVCRSEDRDDAVALEAVGKEPVARLGDAVGIDIAVEHEVGEGDAAGILDDRGIGGNARRPGLAGLGDLAVQLSHLLLERGDAFRHLLRPRLERPRGRQQGRPGALPALLGALTGDQLDAPDALADARSRRRSSRRRDRRSGSRGCRRTARATSHRNRRRGRPASTPRR